MKSSLIYIGLSYSIQILNVFLNVIFMQRLPVSTLGDLAIAKLWLQAFDYTHLGSRFSLDRFLPVTKGYKKRQMYLWVTLATVIVGSLLVIVFSLFIEKVSYAVLSFCLVGMSIAIGNVFKAYFRAMSDIHGVNKIVFFLYVLPLTISVVAAGFDYELFLFLYPSTFLLSLAYFFYKLESGRNYLLLWSRSAPIFLKKMSSVSGLLFLNSIVVYFTLIIDRLFVDWSLGRDELGQYSVIMFVFASLFTVPSIITELLFPQIIKKVVHKSERLFWKEMLFVLVITFLMVVIANVVMYYFVNNYTSYGEFFCVVFNFKKSHTRTVYIYKDCFLNINSYLLKRWVSFN